MPGGGQPGNTNAKNRKLFSEVLLRSCLEKDGKRLRLIADRLLTKAAKGDVIAIKEVADRIEGRVAQALVHATDPENPPTFQTHPELLARQVAFLFASHIAALEDRNQPTEH